MGDLFEKQQEIWRRRNERNDAGRKLKKLYNELKKSESKLAALKAKGMERGQLLQLEEDLKRKGDDYRNKVGAFNELRNNLQDVLGQQFGQEPQELIKSLDDKIPFLLFPVRIETKFVKTAEGTDELWVRVYPDDIAVSSHEKDLTTTEINSGVSYWTTIWESRKNSAAEQKKIEEGAWHVLSLRYGATRAAWIRLQTKPGNWVENFATLPSLNFPSLQGKISGWSEAPRSTVLPDRFVFVRYYNKIAQPPITGRYIPDHLIMGPDPSAVDSFFRRDANGKIEVDKDMEWMINFEKAVEVGMAVKIPLTAAEAKEGFDRLIVLGIRFSTGSATNRQLLETLIDNHHYTSGFSLVPQGTPTNNTENLPSGLSGLDPGAQESFATEAGKELFKITADHAAKPDGQRLAEALRINPEKLYFIRHTDKQDISESMAMNTALWYATMGNFMRNMLGPVFNEQAIENTRNFFINYVSGRGFIPSFRIGNQPYGILATSAFSKWKWMRGEGNMAFLDDLKKVLDQLLAKWKQLLEKMMSDREKRDDFENFLNTVGLQASSVEYYSRLATLDKVTKNYYFLLGGIGDGGFTGFFDAKSLLYAGIGLNMAHDPERVNLKDLTFVKGADLPPLTGPIIDKDPEVPLAEDAALSFNYIQWMLDNTSHTVVQNQDIKDASGKRMEIPRALLYKTLRHAYLTTIHEASHSTLKKKWPDAAQINFHETGIHNINKDTTRLAKDELSNVDAALIGITNTRKPVANYLLEAVKLKDLTLGDIYPIDLADFKNALGVLAKMTTARLERAFAEHLDCCGYRLDAWLTGMVNCRLKFLESVKQQAAGHNLAHHEIHDREHEGIHLGSYGWVEELRPNRLERKKADKEEIRKIFGEKVTGDVWEDGANAGFILTPSLTHAVTAAILRNAYLTHADKDNEKLMAVNLSSERVRNALYYVEGLRNGQELGALLGYQLERGMHEKHPGVEIDEYIYVLRDRFPLISDKLAKMDDPAPTAEVVKARNVINGYDLLESVRGKRYPYQITGLPPLPAKESDDPVNYKKATSIITEIVRLEDSLDALGDLSLAESLFQVVGGNYDRASGILQALTEGKNPPEFQLPNTPRSGDSLTHRLAICFDTSDTEGWSSPPSKLTPRAVANPHLNAWLKKILPDPKEVQWMVSGDMLDNPISSLADLHLEPIDIVYMTNEQIDDKSSDLGRYIVHHVRTTHTIADELSCFFFKKDPETPPDKAIVIHPEVAGPGKMPLMHILPLLKSLKKLLGKSRALAAQDLMLPSEGQNLKVVDNSGYYDAFQPLLKDLKDLFERVNNSIAALKGLSINLNTYYVNTFTPLYTAFKADKSVISPALVTELIELRKRLLSFVPFGIQEALPVNLQNTGELAPKIDALDAQVLLVLKLAERRITEANTTTKLLSLPTEAEKQQQAIDQKLRELREGAQLIFGKEYTILPLFKIHNSSTLAASVNASAALADNLQIEEWLQSVSGVRPPVYQLNQVMINHDLLMKNPLSFDAVQLPFNAGDKWIGLPFEDMKPAPEMTSLLLHQAPADVTALQCGLLVDEWVELIPAEKETTGIAFHFNRPNAVAPQSILLAVSPELAGNWTWDNLLAVINETLDCAKIRAVEPDMVMQSDYADVFPTVLTSFDNSKLMRLSTFFNSNVLDIK